MTNRLYIRLGRHAVDIMTRDLSTGIDALDCFSRPVDVAQPDNDRVLIAVLVAAAERPDLTTMFDPTVVLIDTRARARAPTDGAADDLRDMMADRLIDADLTTSPHVVTATQLDQTGMCMLTAIDERLRSYVSRTFTNSVIMPACAPLIKYFVTRSQRANAAHCYVNIRPGDIDVIIVSRNRLMLANTFDCESDNDIIYYVTAACRDAGLRPDTGDMLYLCGDRAIRSRVTPVMRQYIPNILPVIFPAGLYRASHAALDIPFDLITASLCE